MPTTPATGSARTAAPSKAVESLVDRVMVPCASVEIAAAHHNVSSASRLEAADLATVLQSGRVPAGLRASVADVLAEASAETLVDWVAEGATTFLCLEALAAELLPPEAPTRLFLAACRR